jgi:hypothetical protein
MSTTLTPDNSDNIDVASATLNKKEQFVNRWFCTTLRIIATKALIRRICAYEEIVIYFTPVKPDFTGRVV